MDEDETLGTILCTGCGDSWPCHFPEWRQGGRWCLSCEADTPTLVWSPGFKKD